MIWKLPDDRESAEQVRIAMEIANTLLSKGFPTYIVGGAVRDSLLGIPNYDVDICTAADADSIFSLLPDARPHGLERYCAFRLSNKAGEFEIAHFRSESECDGRHCKVELVDNLDEDLSRRDFTINALAVAPNNREIIDKFGGLADLSARKIRAIGDPMRRFTEDHLRILRAIRFAAKLDFEIEKETQLAIQHEASNVKLLSKDRLRSELASMLTHRNPGKAITLLDELGIWRHVFPKLAEYPESESWRGKMAMLYKMQRNGLPINMLWTVLFLPELPAYRADIRKITDIIKRLGFASPDMKEIISLCTLTNYAYRFSDLNIGEKVELADSEHLQNVRFIFTNIDPSNDFETFFHREFPKLGNDRYLKGDALKRILENSPGDSINPALMRLRYAELAGEVNSASEAENFLEKQLTA